MEQRLLRERTRKIKFDEEEEVAKFLEEIFPKANLYYERTQYAITKYQEDLNQEVIVSSTIPDFEVEDPKLKKTLAIVEVTTYLNSEMKQKQIEVMSKVLPEVPYIVLDGNDLILIKFSYPSRGREIFDRTDSLRRLGDLAHPVYLAAD